MIFLVIIKNVLCYLNIKFFINEIEIYSDFFFSFCMFGILIFICFYMLGEIWKYFFLLNV